MKSIEFHSSFCTARTIVLGFALSFCCVNAAFCGNAKFAPTDNKVIVFAGQNNESFDDYVLTIGIIPAGFMIYTSVQRAEALYEPFDCGAGVCHGKSILEKYELGTCRYLNTFAKIAMNRLKNWCAAAPSRFYVHLATANR